MKYKLLVLDVDGTLLNDEKEITPRTLATLLKVQQMGVHLVLASGRPTYGILPLAKKSFKTTELTIIGILVLIASLFNLYEIYLMFGAGFLALFLSRRLATLSLYLLFYSSSSPLLLRFFSSFVPFKSSLKILLGINIGYRL